MRRVFITGIGVVSPHGEDLNDVFDRVFAGESAIRKVQVEADGSMTDMLLAPVDFEPDALIPKLQGRYVAWVSKMAVVAAHHALEGSGLLVSDAGPAEAEIYMGCGLGGADELQSHYERYLADPPKRLRAASTPMIMASAPASQISMQYRILGPTVTYSMACVSSAVAIGEAFRAIRHSYVDTVLAGGAEAQLNTGTLAGWRELSVLASEHTTGAEASSWPLDTHRTGLVLGEGAVVLVLESESTARARGVEVLAEIVGYGASSDAYN
jgi:3-oxoacyl-[acyl-carrier-protein] synthase II